VIGAADTFRAGIGVLAALDELAAGAVAFDAIARGREMGADVVIVDTAGRLHTQDNLMDELTKIRRVITKQLPDAPHETLMTVDATTGQNGLRQAKLFGEAVDVTGIVLTKLDGTAKGGIALAIANELGLPVKLIGIGEQLEDLRPFDADEFSRALLT
jgi:fused signal recognition particle receptor